MNDRIKELYLEATEQFTIVQEQGLPAPYQTRAFAEKFARLIVRECCGVLTENVEVALDASGSPVYPEGLIYEHFGVEE